MIKENNNASTTGQKFSLDLTWVSRQSKTATIVIIF